MVGWKDRKLLVYSHASVRKSSEWPILILPPIDGSIPPTDIVGSVPADMSISLSIDVVVVFPCVPETPMAVR